MTHRAAGLALAAATWRTSSFSQGANDCVEIAMNDDQVGIRDSKNTAAGMLIVPAGQWASLITTIRG